MSEKLPNEKPSVNPSVNTEGRVQVRIISLLEEAANSIEQIETLTNRTLAGIPADRVDEVTFYQIERDFVDEHQENGSEADHLVFIRYRVPMKELGEAGGA